MLGLLFAVVGLPFILTSALAFWTYDDGDDENGENEEDN